MADPVAIRRPWAGLASLAAGLLLVAALVVMLDLDGASIIAATKQVSAPVFITAALLTLVNQLIGVARWRLATVWLAPDADMGGYLAMLRSTLAGSLLGQVLPMQAAMPMARWAQTRGGWSVGTTLYEQLFDLVTLIAAAIGAAASLALGFSGWMAVSIFFGVTVLGCAATRPALSVLGMMAGHYQRRNLPAAKLASTFDDGLQRAASAPTQLLAAMSALSLLRLLVLIARATILAVALIPAISAMHVALGYPVVGLIMAIPISPAGLGIAEWTWTGVLMAAGAGASAAGLAAIAFRIINLLALICAAVPVLVVEKVLTFVVLSGAREARTRS